MDIDTHRLVIELCTRVGMIFEDASPQALDLTVLNPDDLANRVIDLARATYQAAALLGAANALIAAAALAND